MIDKNNKEFRILICLIEIWDDDGTNSYPVRTQTEKITEVESVEISESFTQVIDTAKITFPKGTVLRKTIYKGSKTEVTFDKNYMISYIENGAKIAGAADFSVGRRIAIRLGYTDDPSIVKLAKASEPTNIYNNVDAYIDYCNEMNYFFIGYITQCSTEEPIEIQCEDSATLLRHEMVDFMGSYDNVTVADFLKEGGRFYLLKDLSLQLHKNVEADKLVIGKFSPDKPMTIHELLSSWAKNRLYSFIVRDGEDDFLAVAKHSMSDVDYTSVIKMAQTGRNPYLPPINFDIDVANNGLTLSKVDKLKLAVRGRGTDTTGKQLCNVITRNPEYNPNAPQTGSNQPYYSLFVSGESKKEKKARGNSSPTDKNSLKGYKIVEYHSDTVYDPANGNVLDQLADDTIRYLKAYNETGLEGTLTLFGDYGNNVLYSGCKITLQDDRHPAKNGDYLVGEIITRFGTKGYRRIVKLPYCLSLKSQQQ